MRIKNIYQDNILKYPLTEEELDIIEEVWDFLKIFNIKYIFISDYRKHVINKIRSKYTISQFYILEKILNKLFWNLRWLVFPLWIHPNMTEDAYEKFIKNNYGENNNIPYSLLLCNYEKYKTDKELEELIEKNPILDSVFYRSFINKLIIIDRKNKTLMSKKIEGSADIFNKNYFNSLTMRILLDRDLYEDIMENPYSIKNRDIELPEFYYQYDYAFPNLNYCCYKFGTKKQRLDRIRKMYYHYQKPKSYFWFKLIK